MELRAYWEIIRRRWWIVAALTVLTAAISFLTSPLTQGNYAATMRVLVSVPAEPPRGSYFTYDNYYSLLSSEYITDDFIEVVRSQAFLADVRQEMGGSSDPSLSIQSQPRSERAPRIITITVSSANAEDTRRAAEAAAKIIGQRASDYFAQLKANSVAARVIDPPVVVPPTAGGRSYLNVLLRTGLGLVVGLGLVFLLHYLDTTVYGAEDVRRYLGAPILAELPPYQDR